MFKQRLRSVRDGVWLRGCCSLSRLDRGRPQVATRCRVDTAELVSLPTGKRDHACPTLRMQIGPPRSFGPLDLRQALMLVSGGQGLMPPSQSSLPARARCVRAHRVHSLSDWAGRDPPCSLMGKKGKRETGKQPHFPGRWQSECLGADVWLCTRDVPGINGRMKAVRKSLPSGNRVFFGVTLCVRSRRVSLSTSQAPRDACRV